MAAEVRQIFGGRKGLTDAARQAPRLLVLPPSLDSAISKFLEDVSSSELKKNVSRLSAFLRNVRDPSGKMVRSAEAEADLDQLEAKEGSVAAREALEEFVKTRPARSTKMRGETATDGSFLYTEKSTAAYVAARMPAIYGVVHRVLSEVSRRAPDFRPSRLLDFGSGPGTALWASREIWPETLKVANLVEPSHAMSDACRGLLADVQSFPSIRSFPSLLDLSKSVRRGPREHSLVISSYTLGELPTKEERIRIVRQLWSFTGDILVLVEPGTPQGSATVREMRSHILQMERKKLRRQVQGPQASKDGRQLALGTAAAEENPAKRKSAGAFVIAPCSHDGACPMDGLSTFCHFSQRVQRTSLQRITKRHSSASLRAYEDEKFSFVVLRRGIRPSDAWPLDELNNDDAKEEGEETNDVIEFLEFDASDDDFEGMDGETLTDSEVESDVEALDPAEMLEQNSGVRGFQQANLSGGWARIIRRPLRRGRHVLLDVCRSVDRAGTVGTLNRVILARKAKLSLRLRAKKLMWGDLWPC